MRNILYGNRFSKSAKRIPQEVLADFKRKTLPLLQENFAHPFLSTKKLSGEYEGCFSSRVAHNYRVTFKIELNGDINLIFIKHRKDAYK